MIIIKIMLMMIVLLAGKIVNFWKRGWNRSSRCLLLFKKNFWCLLIPKHHFHFVNLPWMAEPPPQFLVHCHFLRWRKKMFQFPPESDECNYHDRYNWSCSNSRVRVPLEQMRLAKIDRDWILKGLQGNRQEEKVGFLVTEHWLELISIWMGVKGENKGCF